MKNAKLPPGWSVELLGLISAVEFKHSDGYGLLWCDGRWNTLTSTGRSTTAHLPQASSMAEARKVGTAWISELAA